MYSVNTKTECDEYQYLLLWNKQESKNVSCCNMYEFHGHYLIIDWFHICVPLVSSAEVKVIVFDNWHCCRIWLIFAAVIVALSPT
jgi:hypothetical protein